MNLQLGIVGREEYRFFPTETAGEIFRMLMRVNLTNLLYGLTDYRAEILNMARILW
ncbi:hypothetical protein LWM68_06290 [Niabella sp. W65]|nr:hypothetical protein [Niabella sp. W65]MCH7362405.1 hypothetical protein [Niabella sp. W65]